MNIIVCLDDDFGMMFNHRRQSQDSALRKRILSITEGKPLFMSHYSQKQFEKEESTNITYDDQFLDKAQNGSYCFVESENVEKYEPKIERIIVYKWNRKYPSDLKFTLDLSGMKLISQFEFSGTSHEKITEEVYEK